MGHNSEFDECEFVGPVTVFFYNSPPGAATKIDPSEERETERERDPLEGISLGVFD